ncbi:flavin reductase family protein [Nocardia sp. NPDC006630]|uniref:flavin reductase family protein n=1 Tax=Nocardia sp. NPDC006630 TaxID=3157181 RepID=UPI0033AF7828
MSALPEPTALDTRRFRDVLGHFPSGVVAVTTTTADGRAAGSVVGTFTSVSLDPPLVSFLVARSSATFWMIRETGRFCANALAGNQEPVSRRMSTRGGDKFEGVNWIQSPLGNPILDGIVAWVDCTVEQIVEVGDHHLVVGRVSDLNIESVRTPLLFFRGGYGDYLASATLVMDRLVGWW